MKNTIRIHLSRGWVRICYIALFMGSNLRGAEGTENAPMTLEEMRKEIMELKRRDAEKNKVLAEMQTKLSAYEGAAANKKAQARLTGNFLDDTHASMHDDHWIHFQEGSTSIGMDVFTSFGLVAGGSTAREENLESLNPGGHDPNHDGFDFTGLEFEISGPVDDYFTYHAGLAFHLEVPSLATEVELEEAYVTSSSLPYGLEARAGHYYTEFGLDNRQHAHERTWLDQTLLRSRFFGGDGMRALGARLAWKIPVDWDSSILFGFQNARGSTVASFGGGELSEAEDGEAAPTIAGRPVTGVELNSLDDFLWSVRLENGMEITDDVTATLGCSGAFGPNFTGRDGLTILPGADLSILWKPAHPYHEGQQLLWQTEFAYRYLRAAEQTSTVGILEEKEFDDLAFYTQLLYSFNRQWHVGVRYEYADKVRGDSIEIDGATLTSASGTDPFRTERHRASPLLIFQLTDNIRFRAQYNYDIAEFLADDEAHSFWFGMQFALGSGHPHQQHH